MQLVILLNVGLSMKRYVMRLNCKTMLIIADGSAATAGTRDKTTKRETSFVHDARDINKFMTNQNNDKPPLLNCPFCGSQCDECEAEDGDGYYGCDNQKCTASHLAATREQWNTRTPAPMAEPCAHVWDGNEHGETKCRKCDTPHGEAFDGPPSPPLVQNGHEDVRDWLGGDPDIEFEFLIMKQVQFLLDDRDSLAAECDMLRQLLEAGYKHEALLMKSYDNYIAELKYAREQLEEARKAIKPVLEKYVEVLDNEFSADAEKLPIVIAARAALEGKEGTTSH